MYMSKAFTLLLLALVSLVGLVHGQNTTEQNLKQLDKFLAEGNLKSAKAFTTKQIDSLIAKKEFIKVADYVYYLGKIDSKLNGNSSAYKVITNFETKIKSLTDNKKALRQLALETGSFYESIGDSETAKNYNLNALELTKQMPNASGRDYALVQSNLGVFYSRLGDIPKGTEYHRKALKSLQSDTDSDNDSYYRTYNSMGAMMWYASKYDSAVYYFKEAEKTLKLLEKTPWNMYYRPASLNNNIAGVHSLKGDMDAAIAAMQTTVNNLSSYLKEDISDARRNNAREFLFQAIENYAGMYKDIGDFKKAHQLITYAYTQKIKHLNPESPEITKGKILLGQANLALKNYEEADRFLDEGIRAFSTNKGGNNYWLADANYHKAMLKLDTEDIVEARRHFEESEKYYKASLGNYYDEIYLDFTVNASNFYAQIGEKDKALSMATEALEYIKANQGDHTLLEYYQKLNLADIYYQLGDYENALSYCNEAIDLLDSNDFVKNSQLNNLQVETNRVSGILLKVKTELKLNPNKSIAFLKAKLVEIDNAINILEEKKSIITNDSSTAILIQDNIGVFRLAKELNLELFNQTQKEKYLEDLLGYHESMIYHKIRNRLNSTSVELTANLPPDVLEKERTLRNRLNSFLEGDANFNTFIENEKAWNSFLEELKEDHPEYYKLRYASISQSLQNIKDKIPEASTLVRYLFIDNELYAFVISSSKIELAPIATDNLKFKISELNAKLKQLQPSFQLQSELYNILWQPIAKHISTKRVIIIPDKELFNLSFDLLTPEPCETYSELQTNSLLAQHQISYNYSLFLIDKNSQPVGYDSNFIGFAPEFSEDMKNNYKIAIKDSVNIDYTYLRLLPQPFAKDLAESYSRFFNGDSFLNEKASKQVFTNSAKEHKIIHIGTHAESDNVSPEFSRLIFAKNAEDENNLLYTFEIYNQNLASNLAILTACETGKPTFQPGEGMISLAHAFNYAGSESILTSLWKIDEKSSAKIIENFYGHLKMGLPKDEALQKAKLDYLSTAEGRTLSPEYWAGLVLIGDASPIDFQPFNLWWIWALLFVIVLFALFFFVKNRIASKRRLRTSK